MPKQTGPKTTSDAIKLLAGRFKSAASRPTIYGYKEHPKQHQFHTSTAKGRLYIGGNRSGKTVGGGVEMVRAATGKDPYGKFPEPPLRLRAVGVDFQYGVEKIMKPEVARWLPPSELINGSWEESYDKQLRTLTLDNGSFLEFMSYEQDLEKFAGTSRHAIWFDEEPPEDIFGECKARLIDTGGCWWITMTPVEGMTWVFDALYEPGRTGVDPLINVIEVDMTENPHLNMVEVEAYLSGLSPDEKKARKEGKFVQVGGLVYKEFSEKNILDPFIPPRDWLWVAGMDHGKTNPTAWLWAAVDREGRIFVFDEHYQAGELVGYHAGKVHEINRDHERVPDYYVGDPSIRNIDPITGTSILLEYTDYGIPIVLGNNDQRAGLNRVARYLAGDEGDPRLFITRNCINLLWEIKRLRYSTWATRAMRKDKNNKEEQHKKDDHACDALRYLVSSRPQFDTGVDIPVDKNFLGVPAGLNPEKQYDEDLQRVFHRPAVDEYLGSEF